MSKLGIVLQVALFGFFSILFYDGVESLIARKITAFQWYEIGIVNFIVFILLQLLWVRWM